MNANPKSTEAPPGRPAAAKPEGRETPPAIAFAELFHKGMVRFAEAEKNALDHLVQHNADVQNAWKQTYKEPAAPAPAFFDMAVEGIEKFVEVQKSLLDLAVEQSGLAVDLSKERMEGATKAGTRLGEMVSQSTDKMIAAEKVVLDFAARQNTLMIDRMKRQFGLADSTPAAVAAESIRKGMDVVVETQKEMIDLAARPIKAAAAAAAPKAANA